MEEDPGNGVMFSAASIWEIAIKARLEWADFAVSPELVAREVRLIGFAELAVNAEAAACVANLQSHYRDPFDRLLVAQAMSEPAPLYTANLLLSPCCELVQLIA